MSNNLSIEFTKYQSIALVHSTHNGFTSIMNIDEPYLFSKDDWLNFKNNIIQDKTSRLTFCDCNGEVSLRYIGSSADNTDGLIQYTVHKCGSGGGGAIKMSFKKTEYGESFVNIINTLLEKDYIWEQEDDSI